MDRILRGRPWTFDNQVLMLIKRKLSMSASNVKFDSVSLWIQIWGHLLTWPPQKLHGE